MKPGTYDQVMERIIRNKLRERQRSAELPFLQKLEAINKVSPLVHLLLSKSLPTEVSKVLNLFNQAAEQRIIPKYALADGFAIVFYGAPIHTSDIDLLVVFPETSTGLLDPSPLYQFFQAQGATTDGEYLVLDGLKFQMIPANSGLDAEALDAARTVTQGRLQITVVTLEHLIAMKLKAGRYKDRLHINHLLESGAMPQAAVLAPILQRYGLAQRWDRLLAERSG